MWTSYNNIFKYAMNEVRLIMPKKGNYLCSVLIVDTLIVLEMFIYSF